MDYVGVKIRLEGLEVGLYPSRKNSSFKWSNTFSVAPSSMQLPFLDVLWMIPASFSVATGDKTRSPSGSRGRAGTRISNLPPWLSLLCMAIYIKEEPAMQISASSTLAVYHDGQFWVGLAERGEDGRCGAARKRRRGASSNER